MDFMTGITAASKAIEFAKTIKNIEEAFDQAELKVKAAELMSALADVKIALIQAQDENRNQAEEIKNLKLVLQKAKESVEFGGYFYEKSADGKPRGLPYCPRCMTIDGVAIKMVQFMGLKVNCPECKRHYEAGRFAY